MNTNDAQIAGRRPARREVAPLTRSQRDHAVRLARRERRRIERRRDGRFEYLKRSYD